MKNSDVSQIKMAAVGLLPTYQQQKFPPAGMTFLPGTILTRRGIRVREKYIVLLVFGMFVFVCFGAIFFLPDMRDRVTSDGLIGPADDAVKNWFVPLRIPPEGTGANLSGLIVRHGPDDKDPHVQRDMEELNNKIALDRHFPPVDVPAVKSSLPSFEPGKEGVGKSHVIGEAGLKAGGNVSDSVTTERQAKIKEVWTNYLFY